MAFLIGLKKRAVYKNKFLFFFKLIDLIVSQYVYHIF